MPSQNFVSHVSAGCQMLCSRHSRGTQCSNKPWSGFNNSEGPPPAGDVALRGPVKPRFWGHLSVGTSSTGCVCFESAESDTLRVVSFDTVLRQRRCETGIHPSGLDWAECSRPLGMVRHAERLDLCSLLLFDTLLFLQTSWKLGRYTKGKTVVCLIKTQSNHNN